MPPLMQLPKSRTSAAFMRVMRVKGVDVNVHWSVFVVGAIILLNAGRKPVLTLVGLLCYLSVLLIHEIGHLVAAQRRGSQVLEIRLYRFMANASSRGRGHGLITASSPGEESSPRPSSPFLCCYGSFSSATPALRRLSLMYRAQIFRVVIPSERDGANATEHERGTQTWFVPQWNSKEFSPIIVPIQELCCARRRENTLHQHE